MTLATILLQSASPVGGSGMSTIIMMVALVLVFYFFMIRPQSKKQKEIRNFREKLTVGDRVITAGGIYGKIRDIKDDSFVLEIADNVRVQIDKGSVYPSADATQNTAQK